MAFLPRRQPLEGGVLIRTWVLDRPDQLCSLRAQLFTALADQPMPRDGMLDEIPGVMALVATELATNALTHAGGPVHVCLRRHVSLFILDVIDSRTGDVPLYPTPDPGRPDRFGLRIASSLAGELGWYLTDDTKHVWAQFPILRRGRRHR